MSCDTTEVACVFKQEQRLLMLKNTFDPYIIFTFIYRYTYSVEYHMLISILKNDVSQHLLSRAASSVDTPSDC